MLKIKGKSAVFIEGLTFNTWSDALKNNLKDLKELFKVVELFTALEWMLIGFSLKLGDSEDIYSL